ncbi:MAG: hypothetical protein IT355_04695 [Gemmatimonadaceae bacterium]|nr:hypothetical protein [Gemmatimonadaceae bacterium]
MSDAMLFVVVFGGLFVLRGIAATVVFLWILPEGSRCPQCDAETMRLSPGWLLRCVRSFRSSWCLACGWRGVHRLRRVPSDQPRAATRARPTYPPVVPRR